MKKLLLFIVLGMFLIAMVSSESIGTVRRGDDIELYQTCNNCTSCNFTKLRYIPNSTILLSDIQAIQNGTYYFFVVDGGNTSINGEYNYCYECGNSVDLDTGCLGFTVTPRGIVLTQAESLIYFILAFGVFLLFALSFYFVITIPYGNEVRGKMVFKVTKLKYVKLGFVLLTWVLFTWFLNILIGLSDNFVSLIMYYGFFSFMFDVMNNLALPLGIFIIVICFFEIIRDTNIQKAISKFGSAKR